MAIAALVFARGHISYYDEIMYPYIYGIILYVAFFRKKGKAADIIEKILLKCGRISYPIFLLHYGICHLFSKYYGGHRYGKTVLCYMAVVIVAAVIMDKVLYGKKNIQRRMGEEDDGKRNN